MFLGDYWKINEIQWTIVDFNYWAYSGDKNNNIPHVVVMPDNALYNSKMNETATTEGGYANSKMRTSGLDQAKEMIFNAFGEENILTYRDYLISSVSNGVSSIGNWFDCTVELPNEIMMYGCYIQNPSTNGQNRSNRLTISSSRISLLDLFPNAIQRRANYWLRDVVSGSEFAAFSSTGLPYKYEANTSTGVRPIFGLK